MKTKLHIIDVSPVDKNASVLNEARLYLDLISRPALAEMTPDARIIIAKRALWGAQYQSERDEIRYSLSLLERHAELQKVLDENDLTDIIDAEKPLAQQLHFARLQAAEHLKTAHWFQAFRPHQSGYDTAIIQHQAWLDEAARLEAEISAVSSQKPQSETTPRCTYYQNIKAFFAVCREFGLDVKANEPMRAAISRCLNREIISRKELDGRDWAWITSELKSGNLAW